MSYFPNADFENWSLPKWVSSANHSHQKMIHFEIFHYQNELSEIYHFGKLAILKMRYFEKWSFQKVITSKIENSENESPRNRSLWELVNSEIMELREQNKTPRNRLLRVSIVSNMNHFGKHVSSATWPLDQAFFQSDIFRSGAIHMILILVKFH